MKKKLKVTLICLLAAAVLLMGAIAAIAGSISARPTKGSLAKRTEVPVYDILEWQYAREQEILADYYGASYIFSEPYMILDPYAMNPLSALVMFETESPCEVEVTVLGDTIHSTYTYVKSVTEPRAEIPIIGLYAGRENKVSLKIAHSGGASETNELRIRTEELPADFQTYTLEASKPDRMEPGISLFIACFGRTYTALVDPDAQVRGYLSHKEMAHGTSIIVLKNGNLLATGDEYKEIPYNMSSLWEFNWLGKVFKEYEIPNAVHHEISELPNGDILAASNDADLFQNGTREDVVIVIDRETGEIKKEYDFRKILDEYRYTVHNYDPNIKNPVNIDWMHMNAAIFDEANNAIIVSSPTQSFVVSIDADTSEINWILGSHEEYEADTSKKLIPKLLTPIGDGFEWQRGQHTPTILPSSGSNSAIIDILLLDNGQKAHTAEENRYLPQYTYSRAVHYRINQKAMTVEQIWQYGKERGAECYASYLGSAVYLRNTGNYLIAFGGQLRRDTIPVDDIVSGVLGDTETLSRVVEVDKNSEVVFEVSASAETYQAARIALYSPKSFAYSLGQIKGCRLGKSYVCYQSDLIKAPKIYAGKHTASFNKITREGDRLIIDGVLRYDQKTYLLGKSMIILRSAKHTYVYEANSGLNGLFFLSLDLTELEPGNYHIDIFGVVVEGNNTQGKAMVGHFRTEYKITVE